VKNVENIVEDCRIESIWGEVFPGSIRNFSELYKVTLDEIEGRLATKFSFAEILLLARFGVSGEITTWLESKIPEQARPYYERFVQELEKVKITDWRGTQIVTDSILNIFKEIYANNPQQEQGADDLGEGSTGSAEDTTESEQSQGKGKSSDEGISKQAEEASRLLLKLMPLLGDIDSTGKGDLNVRSEVNSVSNAPKEKTLAESREPILKLLENLPPSKYPVIDKLDCTINDSPSNRGFEDKSHGFNAKSIANTYDGPRMHYKEVIKPNPYIKKMLEEIELGNKPRNWYNSTSGSRLDIRKLIRHEITKDPVDISNPYLKRIKNAGAEIWVLLDIS
ncbi:MAG: hypothetical protein ACP5TF_03390, partial [Candidatus Acidifodinimicrobium sp.]